MKKTLKIKKVLIAMSIGTPMLITPFIAISCDNRQIKKDSKKLVLEFEGKNEIKVLDFIDYALQSKLNSKEANKLADKYEYKVLEIINTDNKNGKIIAKIEITEKLSEEDKKAKKKAETLVVIKTFDGFKKLEGKELEKQNLKKIAREEAKVVKLTIKGNYSKLLSSEFLRVGNSFVWQLSKLQSDKLQIKYITATNINDDKGEITILFDIYDKSTNEDYARGSTTISGFKKTTDPVPEDPELAKKLNTKLNEVKVELKDPEFLKKISTSNFAVNFKSCYSFSNFDNKKYVVDYKINKFTHKEFEDGTISFEYWIKDLNTGLNSSERKTFNVTGLKTLREIALEYSSPKKYKYIISDIAKNHKVSEITEENIDQFFLIDNKKLPSTFQYYFLFGKKVIKDRNFSLGQITVTISILDKENNKQLSTVEFVISGFKIG
ncbi:hypothetical protein DMC14_002250 [Metamycoplasma phocicerebrale]|uniref:Lipoprotein-associated type-17 domain-containing protein n=1 Tax=Metamycoplasma phocicerebrale TaxID=142649 RepID=A0A3Q9VAC7_9BACT|nr:lipoprotein 17-related variable surface protein [Metamycoplasma phocicerebrale]AZZ65595.1 hypothetical protein DMC14_002250 [Metamycoplasma phocicerebrale]